MTTLTLRIENQARLDNGGPVSLTLTGKGGRVGRRSSNDWVLPDPSRHISGHHFEIGFENQHYILSDVSSNGTFLHGERYRLNGPHRIQDGDRFTAGHYIIRAELTALPQPELTAAPVQAKTDPPVSQLGRVRAAGEYEGVWGDSASSPGMPSQPAYARARVGVNLTTPPPEPQGAQPMASEGFGIAQQVSQSAPPQQAPRPVPPPPKVSAPEPKQEALLKGFMEGAEIRDISRVHLTPDVLGRMLGQIARRGTAELMQMLQDRAAIKLFVSEEDRTMRMASGNNPLKFMADPDQAFATLFLDPREGYLTGADGFENAMADIRRHQTAVIAALQPALTEMLEGLAPEEITADARSGLLGGASRKAWEEYEKRWKARASQGENGMLDAFLQAFAKHYADALQKLSGDS